MIMKQPLRTGIKNHIEEEKLSELQLDQLMTLQHETATYSLKHKPLLQAVTTYISVAASIMIALFMLFELGSNQTFTEQIAHEVAKNHINLKPLEVKTSSMDVIQSYFTQLDFMPITSDYFGQFSNTMLGGRYCSIKGVTAAQLRYTNQSGDKVTLYETQYDAGIFSELPKLEQGEPPLELYAKGVKINIWVEKDLLMVSAQE